MVVWAGKGRYRSAGACVNTLPRGVRLTTNVRVWNRAKAAWLAGRSWDTTPRRVTRLSSDASHQQVSGTLRAAAGHPLSRETALLQRRSAGSELWSTASRVTSAADGRVHRYGAATSRVVPVRP